LRYYSVLISLVGIAVTFRFGKALFGTRAGLLAALFYALHDLVQVQTQEVRHYPQQMMMVSLALWLYWRFWRNPTRTRGVVFALAGAGLLYTHYWGGFILFGAAIHALITKRRELRPYIYAFAGIAILYLPWTPVLYHQITLERPDGLPHALANTNFVYRVLLYQLIGVPEVFWLTLATVGAFGAFTAVKRLTDFRRWLPSATTSLPLIVAVLTPALAILLNTVYASLSFRALAVIVPVVIVLAANGLARFRGREQAAIVVFIVIYSLVTRSANPIDRPDWVTISQFIADHSDASDVVLLENDSDEHALAYYLDQTGADINYAYSESTREGDPDGFAVYLDGVLDGRDGVWTAKLGWSALADIRPQLEARGWVQSASELNYGMYDDRPILLWRMDRVPEDAPRTVFADTLALFSAETKLADDGVVVNLLWSASDTPEQNYTVSAFLVGADGTFVNHDSIPMNGLSPTVGWVTGQYYFDSHLISTDDLPVGDYRVGVQVYYFTDSSFTQIETVESADCSDDPNCRFIIVATVHID
jgi:hypothetical protein